MLDQLRKLLCMSFVFAIVGGLWTMAAMGSGSGSESQQPVVQTEREVVRAAIDAALLGASADDIAAFHRNSGWDEALS